MRYARTLLALDKELDLLSRKYEGDTTPQFSIMFDMPDRYRAKMVITRNGKGLLTVKCFSWKETEPLRRAVKFGSNHQTRQITLERLNKVVQELIKMKQNKQFEQKNYDPRVLNVQNYE